MGWIALEQKEPAHAKSYLIKSLEISRELKDRSLEARALNNLALSEGSVNGDYSIAHDYYQQAYEIVREIGDRNAEGLALENLAFVAGMQADFVAAYQYHEQALLCARETGNRYLETYTLINLSAISVIQIDAAHAVQYAQEALEIARKVGERSGEAWARYYLGHAYQLLNDLTKAQHSYQEAVQIRIELEQPSLSMEPIAGLIEVAMRMNDLETAAREAERVLTHFSSGGNLDGTDEPLRVYYACYLLLLKKEDLRWKLILQSAISFLELQVLKFKDEQSRKAYVENVPWRLALQQAAQAIHQ